MKAVRVHEYEKPPSLDDVAEPQVEGPLDVLVHIDAAGVCGKLRVVPDHVAIAPVAGAAEERIDLRRRGRRAIG